MRLRSSIIAIVTCAVSSAALAQARQAASNPVGVWRGTSLCLVHPSACKDELVVYRITRMKALDSLSFDGRRLVNGKEVQMGVLVCHVTVSGDQVTCTIPQGVWHFTIRTDSLIGEFRQPDGTKFRDVRAERSR